MVGDVNNPGGMSFSPFQPFAVLKNQFKVNSSLCFEIWVLWLCRCCLCSNSNITH